MRTRLRSLPPFARRALPYLGLLLQAGLVLLVGNVLMSAPIVFPALSTTLAGLYLLALFALTLLLHRGVRRSRSNHRRRALLRLRTPRPFLRTLLVAVPGILVANLLFVLFYLSWFPDSREESLEFLADYMALPGAWFPLFVLVVLYAPLLEELVFRGWLQGFLERRRWHPALAIGAPALLFAALHDTMVPRILMGLIFGVAVYLTRSLWAGVFLHASNNFIAFLGGAFAESREGTAAISSPPELGWLQTGEARLLLLLLVLLSFYWLFRLAKRLQAISLKTSLPPLALS